MKLLFPLLAAGFLLTACSNLPTVQPAGDFAATLQPLCRDPFPKGKWQFVHSIEAVMPGGRSAFVTGVVVLSSVDRTFRCVILTIEGLAVFDAEWDRRLTVNRAIAPFDSKPFAEGLAEDIRLLFLHPRGSPVESGLLQDGDSLCRYRDSNGGIVDVVSRGGGGWGIQRYTRDLHLVRTVNMVPGGSAGQDEIPQKIELTARGPQAYKLIMNLVEAVRIEE
ncbi:MAG: hypothetical protein AB1512_16885 [Thermodesulfobacteriota bacterium]